MTVKKFIIYIDTRILAIEFSEGATKNVWDDEKSIYSKRLNVLTI